MSQEVAVLTRARDLVRAGWVQDTAKVTAMDGTVKRCAGQAIEDAWCEVLGIEPNLMGYARLADRELLQRANQALLVAISGESNIPNWNDQPGRQLPEVVAAFDRAIHLKIETTDIPVPEMKVEETVMTPEPEPERESAIKKVLAGLGV